MWGSRLSLSYRRLLFSWVCHSVCIAYSYLHKHRPFQTWTWETPWDPHQKLPAVFEFSRVLFRNALYIRVWNRPKIVYVLKASDKLGANSFYAHTVFVFFSWSKSELTFLEKKLGKMNHHTIRGCLQWYWNEFHSCISVWNSVSYHAFTRKKI